MSKYSSPKEPLFDKRMIFYEGKYVYMKVLTEEDVHQSNWVGWFNSETHCTYTQQHYYPNTLNNQLEVLKSLDSPSKFQLGVVDKADSSGICGVVSLNNINFINRNAEISGASDVDLTRGKPEIFLESWSIMLKHGFEQFGLEKIYGGSFAPHAVSTLIRVFNFESEGLRRRHVFKNGKFHDCQLTAVFKDTIKYFEE